MVVKENINRIYHAIDGLKNELEEIDRLMRLDSTDIPETLDTLKEVFSERYEDIVESLKKIEKDIK